MLVDTEPVPILTGEIPEITVVRRHLQAGSAQSAGITRENNEDSLLMLYGATLGVEPTLGFGLFCVADGAGGHGHGEVASALAVRTVAENFVAEALRGVLSQDKHADSAVMESFAKKAIQQAHYAVVEDGRGGVTTLTIALVFGDQLTVGHVGDSRAYLFNGKDSDLLTRDHSYPWRLVEIGEITPEEALQHPKRNLLWNALGQGTDPVVDVVSRPVALGSRLLLCTDGLWGEVAEEEVKDIVALSYDANATCEELIRSANVAGGADNITVILVTFPQGN